MNPKNLLQPSFTLTVLAGITFTSTSKADLIPRGNGMVFDSVQNLTWLQDANYADTVGYVAGGAMDWNTADSWVKTLNVGGYTDWRLPGYTNAEFTTMFITELGNNNDPFNPSPLKPGPFINIQYIAYSTSAYWTDGVNGDFAWAYMTWQNFPINQYNVAVSYSVWPVRTGDVAVQTPPTLQIFQPITNSIVVAWPTNSTGYSLQQNGNLASTNWLNVTNTVVISGTNNQISLGITNGGRFFRLVK